MNTCVSEHACTWVFYVCKVLINYILVQNISILWTDQINCWKLYVSILSICRKPILIIIFMIKRCLTVFLSFWMTDQECYRYVEDIKRSLRRTTFKSSLTTLTSPKPNLPSKYSTLSEILSSTRTPFKKESTSYLETKSNVM